MSNASYIIIKGDGDKVKKQGFRAFYGSEDKGSAKPSFCYPKLKEELKEDIKHLESAMKSGLIAETRRLTTQIEIKQKKERLDKINAQEADAHQLFKENKDACMKRRQELAEEIANRLPTYKDVERHRVNPHRVAREEKQGGFGKVKLEYQVLSHLADEDSNTKFLQKD